MPSAHLTDISVQRLKFDGAQTTYYDATLPAFGVRIGRRTKTWLVMVGKNRQRKTLGYYPDLSLAKARSEARKLLAYRPRFTHISFEEGLEVFLDLQAKRTRPKTLYEAKRVLNRHFLPKLAKRPLGDVQAFEVVSILDAIISTPTEANRAFGAIRQFFRWAAARGYCSNLLQGQRAPAKSTPRARVLSDAELQSIWRVCEQTGEQSPQRITFEEGPREKTTTLVAGNGAALALPRLPAHFATIVKLLILTGQRRGEIAALKAEYISWLTTNGTIRAIGPDGAERTLPATGSQSTHENKCTITFPPSLTKNAREHTFPVGRFASTILSTATSSNGSSFLFPSRTGSGCFNGWSKAKEQLDKLSGVDGWTIHDLRRTFATRLAEMGIAPHVIERLLNHITGTISGISAVYNRAKYVEEMRSAIEAWDARVQEILNGKVGREARRA
jgi:integrase